MPEQRIVVASNRGPIGFLRDRSGVLQPKRGGGGLVTALTGALQGAGGMWLASAMTEEDREQATKGRASVGLEDATYDVRLLAFPPRLYDRYYNGISNRVLWFLHHYLWDIPRTPVFDDGFFRDWAAYVDVNRAFAGALDEEGGGADADPAFLVQDYHLCLVPAMLRELRPAARIAHFSHIPFAGASYVRILPIAVRTALLEGLLGADVLGFQADSWADNFLTVVAALTDAQIDARGRRIRWQGRDIRVGVYPISIDIDDMKAQAVGEDVTRAMRRLSRWRGDARMIVRVDRTELSKNILRGLLAYEAFLRRNRRWRGRVKFLVLLNSSRGSIAEYREYLKECLRAAGRINSVMGRAGWQPIRVAVGDHFPTVLASYRLYDVLFVNPVYDGMNLVAKEGTLLNDRDGVLVLSENAGAFAELGPHAVAVNPFDLTGTADALRRALEMPAAERRDRAERLRGAVLANTAERWVRSQLEDLDAIRR